MKFKKIVLSIMILLTFIPIFQAEAYASSLSTVKRHTLIGTNCTLFSDSFCS